jgi:predicted nucleotidyltransferase
MDKSQIKIINLIKKFKDKIDNLNLDRLILFGSYARNKQNKNSDVDLLVISNDFENIKSFKRAKDLYLKWDIDIDVDFICLTNKELEKKRNQIGIISQALKEGMIIK